MVMAKSGSKTGAKDKNSEVALPESEDSFRIQADDVPTLIWGNGPDGCSFVNRAYLEFLGVSGQADVRHFDWARYIHPDDREAYLNEYLDCFERRVTFSAVFRFRRYDGVYCWMKSVGHPLFTPAGVFQGYVGSTQDITEQKAMEDELRNARDTLEKTVEQQTAELRESKESYRALVETSPDAIIVHKDGRFLYANQAALRLHGVDTLEQLQRMSILETIHPGDRGLIAARMEQMSKGAIAPLKEARLIRPDGQVVYFESTGTQINYGGETALQVIVRDITERKRAEDSLLNNEKFLKNVFNCIQDGVSVLSKDLSVIRYNPTIEKWHGKDLIGKKCYRLFHGRDEPCETCPSVRAVREKTMQHEIVHDLIGWKEIYAYPLVDEDGNVTGTIEQVRDITERQRTEAALRASEEKYRDLVENANSIIIRWDIKGNLTFFNEFAERLFGYSKNEILGQNVVGTIVPRSESTGRDLAALMEAVERCPERYELNVNENICKDGRRVWIAWTNKAIRDVDGNLIEILSVGNDITERKHAEKALEEAKVQAELYLDLMGHDINNMHQIALGYLELACAMHPEIGENEILDKPIEVLQRSSQLIQNVRKLQKLQEGVFQSQDVDVCELLVDVQQEFGAVPHKAITLSLNGCERCHVRANELLHDVFANLVSNAIKHTGDRADINIGFDIVDNNGRRCCRVCVEDNGPGIPDEMKGRVFNRMHKGSARGMGLGLYLVKTLVESYHGKVWVEDRVKGDHSKGARFVVMLPALDN
jgi:PAS domain S-box-containing protein